MRIRVTFIAEIDDQEMLDMEVDISDMDQVFEYYNDNGGEEAFHIYGESFERIP